LSWRTSSAAALLLVALLAPAAARATGPTPWQVVARGESLYGVPWRIEAREEPSSGKGLPRSITIWFSIGRADESGEAGYFSSSPLPLPRAFFLAANSGSDVDSFPEADTSGYASRRAAGLVAVMSDGSRLPIPTAVAPAGLRRHFPWLRGLQFFDLYYAADVEPVKIVAYGRGGRAIARQPV
jgi:hypothetical protein